MTTPSAKSGSKPIVIAPEANVRDSLSSRERFIFRVAPSERDRLKDTFLVLRSSTMNDYAEMLIRWTKELEQLRVIFVLMDTDFDTFLDKLTELKGHTLLSKLFRVDHTEQIDRVLQAWCDGLQGKRFADARLEGSTLIAKACDLTKYRLDLKHLPLLRNIKDGDFRRPRVDTSGDRIEWSELDLDLDFDTMRYHADPDYRLERDLAALRSYSHYGMAIRKLREELELTQEAIALETELSTRHLSRVENGVQTLTAKLIEKLASSHGLSLDEYLQRLIRICSDLETQSIHQKRSTR